MSAQSETPLEEFTRWFAHDYPGPNTIISRPEWHAPKIFRAATYRIEHGRAELLKAFEDFTNTAESYMRYHAEKFYNGKLDQKAGLWPEIEKARAVIAALQKAKP